jgi:dTDP-4-amino-4,6-dideoxygalactose transaminase
MYIVGDEEVAAVAKVIGSGALFRYGVGSECATFEKRYAQFLGAKHFMLAASGSNALSAALMAVGLGPGDEVLVPAHTFMATATSVLSVGAIPIIVDINDSLTIDPKSLEARIGPRTRAVVPVHMWGTTCDMDAIMEIAERRGLIVIEDACQGVGGSYKGRRLGTIGLAGAFSFNYYKNITAGEGGGVITNDDTIAEKVRCAIDPCNYFWNGKADFEGFSSNGARASELMGAMLNVQLDRLDGMIAAMRAERDSLRETCGTLHNSGLGLAPLNSPDDDCSTQLILTLPSSEAAMRFVNHVPGTIAGNTGRHTFNYWDHILKGHGAAHPAMDPYRMSANAECRKEFDPETCRQTLEVLGRTILLPMHPTHTAEDIEKIRTAIIRAAKEIDA